jgi:hypothetical protein
MASVENIRRQINDLREIEKIVAHHLTGNENEYPANNPLLQTIDQLIREKAQT